MPRNKLFQSNYTPDADGRQVIIGLSFDETREFERIDDSLPFNGKPVWPMSTPERICSGWPEQKCSSTPAGSKAPDIGGLAACCGLFLRDSVRRRV